jgi:transcriptional regulator with XRE-family HTH domain
MHEKNPIAPDVDRLAGWREALGRRLRSVREALGESQSTFAARLGVTKLSILKYEAGKTSPTADLMQHLGQSGLDAPYIVFGTRSLTCPLVCAQFAAVHAWVKREGRIRSMTMSDGQVMQVAWSVFSRLSESCQESAPDVEALQQAVQHALAETK